MSKTDRTRPYWVRVQDDPSITDEWHYCGIEGGAAPYRFRKIAPGYVCDIDTGPKSKCTRHFRSNHLDPEPSPPRDYLHGEWSGPDRTRTRDSCRDAARDFNANGDTDVIVETRPHRHEGLWWWW